MTTTQPTESVPEKIQLDKHTGPSQECSVTDVNLPPGTSTYAELRQFLENRHMMETQDVFMIHPEDEGKDPDTVLAKVDEPKVNLEELEEGDSMEEPFVTVLNKGSPISPTSLTSPMSSSVDEQAYPFGRASSFASQASWVANSHMIENAIGISQEKWDRIISRCGVLCGIRMDCCPHSSYGPDVAGIPLIGSTESVIHCLYRPKTYTAFEQTTSERQMSYMKAGWMEQAMSIKPPYVSASMNARYDHSENANSDHSMKFYKAVQTYERVKLTINTTKARQSLHPDFVEDIRNALNDPSSKRLALKNVFERWGHVIATEVVLGAERQMITQATNVTEKTEIHIKYGLETQLKAEVPQSPFEGKTSAGMTEDEMDSFKFALSRASSCFVGGRSDLHGEKFLDQWRQSIESPDYWDVIRRVKVIPTVRLLPPALQEEVMSTVGKPLLGRWLYKSQIDPIKCRHHEVYQPRLTDDDLKHGWFSLGQTRDSSKVLIVKASEDGHGALSPVLSSLDRVFWHKHHTGHSDNFCRLTPQKSSHAPLGSFFYSSYHNGYGPIEGHGQTQHICAVRTDLLAPAQYEEEPIWKDDNVVKFSSRRGSVWGIVPDPTTEEPEIFDLQMFQVVDGADRPTGMVMGLRRDCVEMLDSYES